MYRLLLLAFLAGLIFLFWKSGVAEESEPFAQTRSQAEVLPAPTVEGGVRIPVERQSLEAPEELVDVAKLERIEPEPLEIGACRLDLRFFDIETRLPITGKLQLWRLSVPESETWTAGDVLQFEGEAVDGRVVVEHLPVGEYRVFALFAWDGAESPEAFAVEGALSFYELFLKRPGMEEVSLKLFRINGDLVSSSERNPVSMKSAFGSYSTIFGVTPPWIRQRNPKGTSLGFGGGGGGGFTSRHHQTWKPLVESRDGFPLPPLRQSDRIERWVHGFHIRVGEGLPVRVEIHPEGTETYVAVFPTHAEVQDRLVFPQGVSPHDLTADIDFTVTAVPVGVGSADHAGNELFARSAWLQSQVRIHLSHDLYKDISLTWSPANGSIPEFLLEWKELGD